jgi:6-pyruvoyltetrahydropterin/6-carboxytetrahydropterin synthase
MYTISKEFNFSASHQLLGLIKDHPCGRIHGHNYTLKIFLKGEPFGRWFCSGLQ